MCYNKSNRASCLRIYNSIAVDKLYFSSFLSFHGGAAPLDLDFSTRNLLVHSNHCGLFYRTYYASVALIPKARAEARGACGLLLLRAGRGG
jgi:hypothetical protein